MIPPPLHLCIFGAGEDAKPLVRLGKELGWITSVGDPRPAFASRDNFPEADRVIAAPIEELPQRMGLDARSVAVVMTHHYVHDVPLLRALLPLSLPYLGLLGPRKRAERILADLGHVASNGRTTLHAPTGLDLGADGAAPVALAIVAEIQAVLSGRNGRPLRERTSPIHA